jgi:hypothetical protein
MPRDAIQESSQRSPSRVEAGRLAQQRQERLFHGLHSQTWLAAHLQREAVDGALMSSVEHGKGVFVVGRDAPNKFLVAGLILLGHR